MLEKPGLIRLGRLAYAWADSQATQRIQPPFLDADCGLPEYLAWLLAGLLGVAATFWLPRCHGNILKSLFCGVATGTPTDAGLPRLHWLSGCCCGKSCLLRDSVCLQWSVALMDCRVEVT